MTDWPPKGIDWYWADDRCAIAHGDCLLGLSLLSDRSVDLIVTDPPYGLSYHSGNDLVSAGLWQKKQVRDIKNDNNEHEAESLLRAVLHIAKTKLLKGGACCCCCCCGGGGPNPLFARWALLLDEIIGFKQAVVWDKGGLGMGIHYRRNYEFMLIAQNGSPSHRWNGGRKTPNVWRFSKIIPRANQHPTEKPVQLMGEAIRVHSNPGDLVVDPFMGTGATLRAAKDQDRYSVGFEIEERWCADAVERLQQEVLPLEF